MSINLTGELRQRVGSRDARKLRAAGRIPCSLQSQTAAPISFSMDEAEFMAARRRHEHLFDIQIGKDSHAAVVRDLHWDFTTDKLFHCEFQAVTRGVQIETEVSLEFFGTPKGGVLTVLEDHVRISSVPSLIPDHIEIRVGHLEPGAHIAAGELKMPEGCTLVTEANHHVATVTGAEGADEPEEGEGEGETAEA